MTKEFAPVPTPDEILLDDLHFDPDNPRLPSNKRTASEDDIFQWMLKEADLLELMQSIAATGYSSAEPLLVTKNSRGPGFIVVEGNRRLAALKLLAQPSRARLRTKAVHEVAQNAAEPLREKIPVFIYPRREDILDYLGYRHITGTKPWGPRQKAEYLKQLFNLHMIDASSTAQTMSRIAKMIGTKPYYAQKLLVTLSVVEQAEEHSFWGSTFLDDRLDDNFSVLHTALSYENIAKYIGLDSSIDWDSQPIVPACTKQVLEWVCGREKVIGESRDLKRLNSVVGNPVALSKLASGAPLEIAAEYSGEALTDFRTFLQEAFLKLNEADRLVSKVEKFVEDDIREAEDVAKLARKIYRAVQDAGNADI